MSSNEALRGDPNAAFAEIRDSVVVPKPARGSENEQGASAVIKVPDLSHLTYHLLRPAARAIRERALLQQTYRTWKRVWGETFKQLSGLERLYSDEFVRQHELVTLFEGERCVGLAGFRYIDLDAEATRDDSYFAIWPDYALASARAWGRSACIVGNLVVLPEYRGQGEGVSLKEVLTVLSMYRLSNSLANMALVTTRNDRGMSDLMYRCGAHRLVENATLHGVSVDLAVFSRWGAKVALLHPRLSGITSQMTASVSTRRIA